MKRSPVTVAIVVGGSRLVAATLAELGCSFEEARPVARTILDTFDGRLHRAGFRVELLETNRLKLFVSLNGMPGAGRAVADAPRFAGDLPPGRFSDQLTTILGGRALLPTLRVTTMRRRGFLRNHAGDVIARVVIFEQFNVDGHDSPELPTGSIEITDSPDSPKAAAKLRSTLRRLGVHSQAGDTLTMIAAAVGLDERGFRDSPTVPLDPAASAIDGFRAVLANLAATITANWLGTIDEIDPEFLHDLRIAVRRTRTVLRQGKLVLPPAVAARAIERFGWLAGLTSDARDLDVAVIGWDDLVSQLSPTSGAALEPVHHLIETSRRAAMIDLGFEMRSPPAQEFIAEWTAWLREPIDEQRTGTHAHQPLGWVVARTIARAHDNLVQRGRAVTDETPAEELHDLRKHAKKLRYELECFASLFPTGSRKAMLGPLKALQDNLGEFQDTEVQAIGLRSIATGIEAEAPFDTMLAMSRLAAHLDSRRGGARGEFDRRFRRFDSTKTAQAFDAALGELKKAAKSPHHSRKH